LSQLRDRVREIIRKHFSESSKGIILSLRVKPGSQEPEDFLTLESDEIVFYTSEPPEKGRANAALIKYLAKNLGIPVSKMDIVYGHRGTLKKIVIYDANMDDLVDKMTRLVRLV